MFGKHSGIINLALGFLCGALATLCFEFSQNTKGLQFSIVMFCLVTFSVIFTSAGVVHLSARSGFKIIDPFYWYMTLAHRRLLKAKMTEGEKSFIETNINKHRLVQWINLGCAILIFVSLQSTPAAQISTVISALLAPVMVMGAAWFAVSFGSIPEHLIECSIEVTFWMYCGFKLSLTTMFLAIGFITVPTLWPVFAIIYVAVDFSCAQYDTCDGLKAGLDEALLKHSRAAVMFYKKQGIGDDTQNNQN